MRFKYAVSVKSPMREQDWDFKRASYELFDRKDEAPLLHSKKTGDRLGQNAARVLLQAETGIFVKV